LLSAAVAGRRAELYGHHRALPRDPPIMPGRPRAVRAPSPMTLDPITDWITPRWGQRIPLCPFVKITQLLGEVRCYLLPGHDGDHCSADWMEWT